MTSKRKQQVYALLKGIETGDPDSVKVVNEDKYIQHNPQTREGGEGLAHLFKRLSKTNPKVEIVRIFEDGDFVFGHTIYDFASVRIGFEVFRYEGEHVVEHWDNIQPRIGDMVGGSTEVSDLELTEANRTLIGQFIDEVFVSDQPEKVEKYVHQNTFVEHSPEIELFEKAKAMKYTRNHRILAEGNFVLTVNEGYNGEAHTSFYDLFRINQGKIVEHWETTEVVPPRSQWKNDNGKFQRFEIAMRPREGRFAIFIRTLDELEKLGRIKFPPDESFRSARFLTAADSMGFSYNENRAK